MRFSLYTEMQLHEGKTPEQLYGEVLDIDHGYPARIIAPGRPGVLQTKWLDRIEVLA